MDLLPRFLRRVRYALACPLFPRRHDHVDVLRSPDAAVENPPFSLRVVRVHSPPMPFRVEIIKRLFMQVPAMRWVDPAADALMVRSPNEYLGA